MSLYRHSATSLKDGSLHQLAIPYWGREVVFDGVPVETSQPVHSGWLAVDGRGIAFAICTVDVPAGFLLVANDGRDDVLMMNPGGGGGGLGFAALRPLPVGVEIYFLAGPPVGDEFLIDVRDQQYQQRRTFTAPYSSMGFLQIRGETDVVMSGVGTTREIVPGVMAWDYHEDQGWAVGKVELNPPGGSRGTVALRLPDGRLMLASLTDGWDGYVNLPPHLAVSGDGQAVYVAIPSGETVSPAPDQIVWVDPPTLPEPHVEPYHRPLPHFWYFTLDADHGYGDHAKEILDACWCATESDVVKANARREPVIASASLIDHAIKPAMVMVSNDFAGATSLEQAIDEALPVARDLDVGMIVFDDHGWRSFPPNIPDGAILACTAFRNANETAEDTLGRLLEITARCQSKGHRVCWVLGADDRLQTLTDFQISETIQTLTSVFAELSNVAVVGAFSYARRGTMPDGTPTGGAILHPNAAEWIRESRRASDPFAWSDYRLESEPEQPEEPDEPEAPVSIKTSVSFEVTNFRFGDFDEGTETRPANQVATDETVEVVKHPDGTYSIKNDAGTEWLSIQRDGSRQSRSTSDPTQPRTFEKFNRKGNTLVELSKDAYGGFLPPGRPPVTILVAGDL